MSRAIRLAEPRDLGQLEDIENKADALFLERFRPTMWRPAPTAEERSSGAGYILVAAENPGGGAVGFVQVLLNDDEPHLEQLSVLPAHGRRGYGRALVEAAKDEAVHRGFHSITLRTFADVPWNAPFYSQCGFVESEPVTPFQFQLLHAEGESGSARHGRRIQMTCPLASTSAGQHP